LLPIIREVGGGRGVTAAAGLPGKIEGGNALLNLLQYATVCEVPALLAVLIRLRSLTVLAVYIWVDRERFGLLGCWEPGDYRPGYLAKFKK
jgi:hypothetical protein